MSRVATRSIEKAIAQSIRGTPFGEELCASTPSLQLSVFRKGQRLANLRFGKDYEYFDWASLTKITFTTSLIMRLQSERQLNVNDRVQKYLPWFPWARVRMIDLLCHRAGMSWWQPFYRELNSSIDLTLRLEQLKSILVAQNPRSTSRAVYSDIDFLYVRYILESCLEMSLKDIFQEYRVGLNLGDAHFCYNNRPVYLRSQYAPTERCPWRKKVLQGEVHDENTWALDGYSSHAGLFGRMQDLEQWALALRQNKIANPAVTNLFLRRQMPASRGDWAVGFMMPTRGSASCGEIFSANSVGHTGFTGTSFWWDRNRDVMILILSNRVHPTRENKSFVQLRPRIHDLVMGALGYE